MKIAIKIAMGSMLAHNCYQEVVKLKTGCRKSMDIVTKA